MQAVGRSRAKGVRKYTAVLTIPAEVLGENMKYQLDRKVGDEKRHSSH